MGIRRTQRGENEMRKKRRQKQEDGREEKERKGIKRIIRLGSGRKRRT
jgi:hypothetical protein